MNAGRSWLAEAVLAATCAEALLLPLLGARLLPRITAFALWRGLAPGAALAVALLLALRGASTTAIGLALTAALALHGVDLVWRGRLGR